MRENKKSYMIIKKQYLIILKFSNYDGVLFVNAKLIKSHQGFIILEFAVQALKNNQRKKCC
jgi:hypothetical protein